MIPAAGNHGDDAVATAAALGVDVTELLDLAASMNPVSPDVRGVLGRHLGAVASYPDPARATAALAEVLDVPASRVLLTNGGAEAIALVAALTGPGWADECDFSLYRRHLVALDPDGTRWRSNPHNPLGGLAGSDVHADVWDEAFWALATGTWTRGDARRHDPSTRPWVVGSLTKVLDCPGLRVGYLIAPTAADRDRAAALQPRWSVNGLVCAALPELLDIAAESLPVWAAAVGDLRARLVTLLERLGLQVTPAAANWVLVHDRPGLREALLPHRVLVRDCTSFGLAGTTRVAVPRPEEFDRLAAALDAAWSTRERGRG